MPQTLDYEFSDLARKYQGQWCRVNILGEEKIVRVHEQTNYSPTMPVRIESYVPNIVAGVKKDWKEIPADIFGAIHQGCFRSKSLDFEGKSYPVGQLLGLSKDAQYFVTSTGGLYFGARRLQKSFRWGVSGDDYEAAHKAGEKLKSHFLALTEFVYTTPRKEKATLTDFKYLSPEVAVIKNVIHILGIAVGFLDGTYAKVKNRAVGKILLELEPSWTISYW